MARFCPSKYPSSRSLRRPKTEVLSACLSAIPCRSVALCPLPARARAAPSSPPRAQPQTRVFSFDHLVGAGEEHLRDREAERSGGVQVDREHEALRLLNRKVSGFGSLQYLINVSS